MLLLLAPIGWCSRRHRAAILFWLALGVFAAGQVLGIPGLLAVFRLFPFRLLMNNRLIMLTGWATIVLGVVGLEVLWRRRQQWQVWYGVPLTAAAALGVWCAVRAANLSEPVASKLEELVRAGRQTEQLQRLGIRGLADVYAIQHGFVMTYASGAVLCGLVIVGLLAVWVRARPPRWMVVPLGVLLVAEMIWLQYGYSPQCDPEWYYPDIPILRQIAERDPTARVCGVYFLPADLSMMGGLRDIRGYDGADPKRLVDVLELARAPDSTPPFKYARVQHYSPIVDPRPSPIVNMLGVRYLIFRQDPPLRPVTRWKDYRVFENPRALPRAYVPAEVRVVEDDRAVLAEMGQPSFQPAEVADVDQPIDVPATGCHGTAEIVDEIPNRVTIDCRMETPGVVVLTDLWYAGWQARLNGREVPILRANYAFRGVGVPAGESRLVFTYRPAGFIRGLWLAGGALLAMLIWAGTIRLARARAGRLAR
jgi:hypothetical protein